MAIPEDSIIVHQESSEDEMPIFNIANNIIDRKDENTFLIHMKFTEVPVYTTSWCFNRKINEEKVQELTTSLETSYPIPFTLHAVYDEKHTNPMAKILILDGQHRVEAIRKYIANDVTGQCDYKVWIWIYKVSYAETNNTSTVLELFKKINNNRIFSEDELPDTFIIDFVNKLCDIKLFKKNIGTNVNNNTSHSPRIHKKELNALFNQNKEFIRADNKSISDLINNILIINHRLSMKTFEQLYAPKYRNSELEKKRYGQAVSSKFFINLKNTQYSPDIWIQFINKPNEI